MADYDHKEGLDSKAEPQLGDDIAVGVEDVATIPKGTIDPVYEAKARVLNRAVCMSMHPAPID